MKKKITLIIIALLIALSLTACGGKETTVTGVVVSVEGTVISITEMNADMGEIKRPSGEMPSFDGEMPEGMTPPEDSERPEGGEMPSFGNFDPENFDGEMPGGMTPPEDSERPEGGRMKLENVETTDIDIKNAHISVETDGVKASGSIEDVKAGTMVTVTLNKKGEATNVLVSSRSLMIGGRGSSK